MKLDAQKNGIQKTNERNNRFRPRPRGGARMPLTDAL